MPLSIASAVGLVGTLLAFAYTVPQFRKLRGATSAAGVSIAALACSTISGVAWTTYGVLERDIWVVLTAAVAVPATLGALLLAWHRGGSRERLWLPVAWAGVLVTVGIATLWVGPRPATVVLGCSVALLVTPAALTAWRSADVSAIAASGWLLLILDALVAGAYGVLADIDANVIYGAIATLGAVAVLVRISVPDHVHARLVRLPVAAAADLGPLGPEDLSLVA